MVGAVTRIFGVHNLPLAEDVVQEAFCRATDLWSFRGVPENPSAWLMATAKNCALDVLRRERTTRTFVQELGRLLESEWTMAPVVEELFMPNAIKDDQPRMIFSCCNPRLSEESQVALILHILCGFSVDEIASAFVRRQAAIEKRNQASEEVLADQRDCSMSQRRQISALGCPRSGRRFTFCSTRDIHGASPEASIRSELCGASRTLHYRPNRLIQQQRTCDLRPISPYVSERCTPSIALGFIGQLDRACRPGSIPVGPGAIHEGLKLMELSAEGSELSEFHLESAIAATHATASSVEETDWSRIVGFYDTLMTIKPSTIVALNRAAIAVAERDGPERGLAEIRATVDQERLDGYQFYAAAIGELELRSGRHELARQYFERAAAQARNRMERGFLKRRTSDYEK
jgi:RNA polymerase sigma-70 factor (ECF subfamily)